MNEITQIKNLVRQMNDENLMIIYEVVLSVMKKRLPTYQEGSAADRISEFLVLKNKRNVSSTEIAKALDMPQSTVRLVIREKLIKDKRFNVYLNRKPLEISYNGEKK